ncbi:anti-phage ZorAB system protein ZorA [Sphingobium aquiterrae]|uniref:anti-phage ZorAB system protein ZorA n=1 Tax=Sphingobium aquiterrae TaxID=2038656 RepID=UPI00301AF157
METHINPVNGLVVLVFGNPLTALWISLSLLLLCAFIIVRNYIRYHRPLSRTLKERVRAFAPILDAEDTEGAQRDFAERFYDLDASMVAGGREAHEIRQAWSQFRETILDESEVPMRATMRADGYFLHLGDDTRVLAWWANIFVALGLTFTFLGIVAALTTTVTALSAANGSANMTPALINLLTITSVKFWTSIAGVLASIILRFFDRHWHSANQRQLECIVDALDRGTLFSPPQRIAAEQLRETKEQTTALKSFSHELAIAIGENLERQMKPMVQVLGGIQTSIDDFKNGSFNQIGKELGDALSKNAGAEMAQLGAALDGMTTRLSSMHEQIEGSGRAANDQIAQAARDFSVASDRMSQMFGALHERIDATGAKLTESAETASNGAVAQFAQATSGIQTAFDQMRGEIADIGTKLTAGADAAADRNADLLARAAEALEAATSRASTGLGKSIDDAVAKASEESAKAISSAFAAFGSRFDEASSGLIDTLRSTAGRMESLATSIERSAQASDSHASKLVDAGVAADGIASTLNRAANDLQSAAAPIRTATETIGAAVGRVQDALVRQTEAAGQNQTSITAIAERLTQTTESATKAWNDYRDRFEGVDKALASALDQIKGASGEHAAHLNEQVGRMDNALAGAVDKLSAALEPLTELAEQIEDLLGKMQPQA